MYQRRRKKVHNSSKLVAIGYDEYIREKPNSWEIVVGGKRYHFPFSLCSLDERSYLVFCPLWMAIDKGIENYIIE